MAFVSGPYGIEFEETPADRPTAGTIGSDLIERVTLAGRDEEVNAAARRHGESDRYRVAS